MVIHVLNGPNLNLLGKRETDVYGNMDFETYFSHLKQQFPGDVLHYFQSNHEGALLDYLHEVGFEQVGIVLNAGAYTHTSIALADAIKAISAPVVEVHISNIYEREAFRHHSYIKPNCVNAIVGQGLNGYALAIEFLKNLNL